VDISMQWLEQYVQRFHLSAFTLLVDSLFLCWWHRSRGLSSSIQWLQRWGPVHVKTREL